MHVEKHTEKAFLLIVLLKELFAETALLSRKVQQFTVVKVAPEILGKPLGYYQSAASELPSDVDYYFFIVHSFYFLVDK